MKPFPHSFISSALFLCLLALGGCQTYEGLRQDIAEFDISRFKTANSVSEVQGESNYLIDADCPKIEISGELSMLHDFKDNRAPSPDTRISTTSLTDARSSCVYGERSVTVDLQLDIKGELGPAADTASGKTFLSQPFFIAVTSSSGKILAKELFDVSMAFEAGQTTNSYTESLRQIIPADSRSEGSRIKVVAGFQLLKDQLGYNRALIVKREEEARLTMIAQQEALKKAQAEAEAAAKAAAEAEKAAATAPTAAATSETIVIPPTEAMVEPTVEVKVPQAPKVIAPENNPDYLYIPPEEAASTTNRAGPIDITVPE